MKQLPRHLVCLSFLALPAFAIEPPVDPEPIPPQKPAEDVAPVRPAQPVEPEAMAIPMPEVNQARPYLGVILDPVPEVLAKHLKLAEGEGIMVAQLVPGGPAEGAGLEVNDILLEIDAAKVGSAEAVRDQVAELKVGDEIKVALIHEGERKEVPVTLGEAPAEFVPAAPQAALGGEALEGMLENLPGQHADRIREALENNLQEGEGIAQLQKEMMQRMRRQMRAGGAGGAQMFNFNAESSIRLLDNEGSIEMKSSDGSKEAKVFDKEGTLLWEGPYDTEQDKAAVPDDIRQRIERLDFDMDLGNNGLKLRLGPNRFLPLDEVEEDQVPEPEDN